MTHVQTVKMKCRPLNDPKSVKICSMIENRCWQWMNEWSVWCPKCGSCVVLFDTKCTFIGGYFWMTNQSISSDRLIQSSFHSFTRIMRNDLIYMAVLLFSPLFYQTVYQFRIGIMRRFLLFNVVISDVTWNSQCIDHSFQMQSHAVERNLRREIFDRTADNLNWLLMFGTLFRFFFYQCLKIHTHKNLVIMPYLTNFRAITLISVYFSVGVDILIFEL